jgi:hypothetical protein
MSAALQLPVPTPEPDPPRAGTDTPTPIGRVLSLVRKLLRPGRQTVRHRRYRRHPRPHHLWPAPPDAQPADPAQDPRLARLPTEEQIAAEVRRRPVGAVIADICRDLGIMPTHPLWGDLSPVILRYGGNLPRLWREILAQLRPRSTADSADRPPAWPAPPQRSPVPATGPP